MPKPKIAVTMGDPAGVGPEICLDLLNAPEILGSCQPVIFGDLTILQACARQTGKALNSSAIQLEEITRFRDHQESCRLGLFLNPTNSIPA